MPEVRHWLLIALTCCLSCFYSTSVLAQINVSVQINGIEPQLEANVRSLLSIEQQKNHHLLSEGRLQRLHAKAPEEIRSALQPFGYYRPVIEKSLVQNADDAWTASYQIQAGPALTISELKLDFDASLQQDEAFQALIKNPPLKVGDVFNHAVYDDFKARLSKYALEQGYFNAQFTRHRVEVDLDSYTARINLQFSGGHRYTFGEVILQQSVLDDALLLRYIPFEKGEPYSLQQMIELQQALNDSQYAQTVEVSPGDPIDDQYEIPVIVKLTPRKPHRFTIGLGYGSDTGARAKFGWQMPRLNQRGHRLDTEARISELGYSLSGNYHVPVFNPRTDQLSYKAGVVNETTDTSESTLRIISATLKHNRGNWREYISLNYQQEDFTVADDSGDSTLLMPGISWSRTWGDQFIHAFDGLRFDISLRGANDQFMSDTSFTQLQGGIKAISPLNRDNRIIARGRLGSTWTDEFNQLPSSVRFFTGGAQSVRGYAYESLGPQNEDGEVVGGKLLMVGSIEFEHSFNSRWGVAVFYDGGNAIDDFSEKLARGSGLGVRWQSPVGPVRIDLARALSDEEKSWRIHINIGPDL